MSKPPARSALAAAIVLHGGPTPNEFKKILDSLSEARIDSENYSWGPSYELANQRLTAARKTLREFIQKL